MYAAIGRTLTVSAFLLVMFLFHWSADATAAERGAASLSGKTDSADDEGLSTITISGRVTDMADGRPMPGAKVEGRVYLHVSSSFMAGMDWRKHPHAETVGDKDGNYVLTIRTKLSVPDDVQGGSDHVSIMASVPGYAPGFYGRWLGVKRDLLSLTGVDIALEKGKRITGTVVDPDGKPVEGALVTAGHGILRRSYHQGQTVTDSQGRFALNVTTARSLAWGPPKALTISKDGVGQLFIAPVDRSDFGRLVLPKGATVAGRVVDTEGRGLPDCEVIYVNAWADAIYATTDADGRYRFQGIAGRETLRDSFQRLAGGISDYALLWYVRARKSDSTSFEDAPYCVASPEDGAVFTCVDIVIGRPAISGHVVSRTPGFKVEGLEVLVDDSMQSMQKRATVNARGEFQMLFCPPPGKHWLFVYYSNSGERAIGKLEFEAKPGSPSEGLEIPIDPLARLDVELVDESGRPVKGVSLFLSSDTRRGSLGSRDAKTDEHGRGTVFLWPDAPQYISTWDKNRVWFPKDYNVVTPKPGSAESIRFQMTKGASIRGKMLVGRSGLSERLLAEFFYEDGYHETMFINPDSRGAFRLDSSVRPGTATIKVVTTGETVKGTVGPVTLKAGKLAELGDITLKPQRFFKVSGRVLPSKDIPKPIRLFLPVYEGKVPAGGVTGWARREYRKFTDPTEGTTLFLQYGSTNEKGEFYLYASEGDHRIAVFPAFWHAGPDVIGLASKDISVHGDINGLVIRLEETATVNVTLVDRAGKPLRDLTPAAWANAAAEGPMMAGNESDTFGRCTMHILADRELYVGVFDVYGQYFPVKCEKVKLGSAETKDVTVVVQTRSERDGASK